MLIFNLPCCEGGRGRRYRHTRLGSPWAGGVCGFFRCGCRIAPCHDTLAAVMGFTTTAILTTAAAVAGKAIQAKAEYDQGKALKSAADLQQRLNEQRAQDMTDTALDNQRRSQRNAHMELARARGDAARSNLAVDGSTLTRETDLATRLEDDINNRTNAALQEVNTLRSQSALDNWDLRNQARQSRIRSLGTAIGAAGSIFSGINSARNGTSAKL